MRVVTFFVYLVFFLLRGYDASCAADYPSHQKPEITAHREYLLIQGHREQYPENLITDEIVDEDPETSTAKKFKLLTSYLELAGLSEPDCIHPAYKTPPPFFSLLSCKYITQRVLRI